jgi:uncharacterized protein (DUF362 family)/Pyruvate/2-oxoacid:ferredoxin oxidoreductase delta subunit
VTERSTVAVVRCETYEAEAVHAAVGRGLQLLGGAQRFVQPGEQILLKPNLLVAAAPDSCVTTHPSVFEAVIRHLHAAGAVLSYGDSPGFGTTQGVARKSGLVAVAERHGVPLADFADGRLLSFPEGRLVKQFFIANGVLDADGLVSLGKFKTHQLTRLTAAVKNQFGCIVGMRKGEFHARMPDVDRFCQMLVDLNRALAPRLYVVDGIVAMEGNGPRNGDPRPMNVLLLSTDPVALDATVARMMALDPGLVGTITFGEAFGLGTATAIDWVGDPVEGFVARDYRVVRSPSSTTGPAGGRALARRFVIPRPVIDAQRCTRCGTCVTVCPVDPKAVNWRDPVRDSGAAPPQYDYTRCIRCYCCQEMCPENAIRVRVPLLGRVVHGREQRHTAGQPALDHPSTTTEER